MRNRELWRPTKVVEGLKGWRPSRDPIELGPSSRVAAACQIRAYEAAIRAVARGRLLDLGCGHVPYYGIYRGLIDDSVCVDWGGTTHRNDFLDHEADLNAGMPFLADSAFDTVLLTDVLEHIHRPAPLLAEVARVLKGGGCAIIAVPFLYWIHEQPHDYHRYTEFSLRRLCEEAGLEVEQLTPYGGAPEVLADIAGKALLLAGLGRLCGSFAALSRVMLSFAPVRHISRATEAHLPLGYVLVARKPAATATS